MLSSENRTPSGHRGQCSTISDSVGLLTLSIEEILLTEFHHITSSQGGIAPFEGKKKSLAHRNAKKIISLKAKRVLQCFRGSVPSISSWTQYTNACISPNVKCAMVNPIRTRVCTCPKGRMAEVSVHLRSWSSEHSKWARPWRATSGEGTKTRHF